MYKRIFKESSRDLNWIAKRITDYVRGIETIDGLVEGIGIDLGIPRNDKRTLERLEDHILNSFDDDDIYMKKGGILILAREIYLRQW